MPNSTRISSAIRTIAWPDCLELIRIFGTVNRIRSDDDVVADNLLDDRRDRLECVPDGDLDGLIADRGLNRVAAGSGGGIRAQTSSRAVRVSIARGAGVGNEDPTRVHRGQ